MSGQGLGFENFLNHSTNAPRSNFLSNWKKSADHSVNVWIHTSALFYPIWRHPFSRVIEKDDGTTDIWGTNWVCWEDEKILKVQHRRLEDGTRVAPPEACALCKLLEWIRGAIDCGQLDWLEPVFRFECDDPRKTVEYHAGGMIGMFGDRNLTNEQKVAMKRKGIYAKEVWRTVAHAKPAYLMCVVEDDHPENGVQIAIEPSLLGDKLRLEIRKAINSLGKDRGDFRKFPYAFQFQHDPTEGIAFGKKYDVCRMERLQLTDEIRELLNSDPPDVSHITTQFDADEVRTQLEQHALVDIPWDVIFPPRQSHAEETPSVESSDATDEGDLVACDKCGKVIKMSDSKCPHCGTSFEEVSPEPEPEPIKPVKTRSEAIAAKPVAKPVAQVQPQKPTQVKVLPKLPRAQESKYDPGTPGQEDPVPF